MAFKKRHTNFKRGCDYYLSVERFNKERKFKQLVTIIIFVLVGFIFFSGCGFEEVVQDALTEDNMNSGVARSVKEISIGESTSYDNWTYSVVDVSFHENIAHNTARGQFVVAYVRAKNNTDGERRLGEGFFVVEDEIGKIYSMCNAASYIYSSQNKFEFEYRSLIGPDAYATVPYAFDVPTDVNKLIMFPPNIRESDLNGTSPIVLFNNR